MEQFELCWSLRILNVYRASYHPPPTITIVARMYDDAFMNTSAETLLRLLADGRVHSGTELGSAAGISRAAVWKQLQTMEAWGLGYVADAGKGYRLSQPLDLLDRNELERRLTEARVPWQSLNVALTIDSTNSYLLQLPRKQANACWDICLAEYQSAGRGRRGRQWQSPLAANIYMSLRREFSGGLESLSGLSLAVGVAVAKALEQSGIDGVGLKWPNDLRARERKLGGILIELSGESGGPCSVVIGIGLNVHMQAGQSADIDQPWIAVDEIAGRSVTRNELVVAIITRLEHMAVLFEAQGFSAFVEAFQRRDAFHGAHVAISGVNDCLQGQVVGVDTRGALLLQTAQGLRTVMAGEVSLRADHAVD